MLDGVELSIDVAKMVQMVKELVIDGEANRDRW